MYLLFLIFGVVFHCTVAVGYWDKRLHVYVI